MATAKEIVDYIRYNDWGDVAAPTNWYHDEQKEKLVDCVWVRKVPLVSRHVGSNFWENETSFDIYLFTKQDYLDTVYNQLLKILQYYPWRSISYSDDFSDISDWVGGVQSYYPLKKEDWTDMTGWTVAGTVAEDSGAIKLTHVTTGDDGSIAYAISAVWDELQFTGYANVDPVGAFRGLSCHVLDDLGGEVIKVEILRPPSGSSSIYVNGTGRGNVDRTKQWDIKLEFDGTGIIVYYKENGTTSWTTASSQSSLTGRAAASVRFQTRNSGISSYDVTVDDVIISDGHEEVMDLGATTAYLDITSSYTHVLAIEVFFASADCYFAFADHVLADILGGVTTRAHFLKINGVGELQWEYYSDVITGTPDTQVTLDQVLVAGWNTISIDLIERIITVNGVEDLATIRFNDIYMVALTGGVGTYFDNLVLRSLTQLPERTHDIILSDLGQSQYDKDEKVHKFKITESTVVQR